MHMCYTYILHSIILLPAVGFQAFLLDKNRTQMLGTEGVMSLSPCLIMILARVNMTFLP